MYDMRNISNIFNRQMISLLSDYISIPVGNCAFEQLVKIPKIMSSLEAKYKAHKLFLHIMTSSKNFKLLLKFCCIERKLSYLVSVTLPLPTETLIGCGSSCPLTLDTGKGSFCLFIYSFI